MLSSVSKRKFARLISISLSAFLAAFAVTPETFAKAVVEKQANLGIIKGVVRDEANSPIAEATVAIFRAGTTKLLKQVRSAADGSFLTKVLPGTYTVLAVAQGFNPVTLSEVEVNRSAELNYKFKLERSGSGNTLPEKQLDRNSSKWRIRAAQMSRSIYQSTEGNAPIDETDADENAVAGNETILESEPAAIDEKKRLRGQSIVESYFGGTAEGNFSGLNFATLQHLNENTEIVFAGQTGTGKFAPQRFEAGLKLRASEKHQIRLNGAIARFGKIKQGNLGKSLGQASVQAFDEWNVHQGVIVVLGFDYSRFIGAGNDYSLNPRFGLQFDANSKTRLHTAYTGAAAERTWENAAELEGAEILFREPVAVQELVFKNEKPRMSKSRRLEFGVERVLDNKSSVEATGFFDTVHGRGVGINNFSFDTLDEGNFGDLVANQQGRTQGVRVVYSRRLNGIFSTSAGYAVGSGQKLSQKALTNPASVFEDGLFQTFYGQFDADFATGTEVKTVFRFSPDAAVFAIDPFQGRLAIYDPSLSIKVTQSLPNWGLPIHAQAVVDARNLFDFQTGGDEGCLRLTSQRRTLRGGIMVRF